MNISFPPLSVTTGAVSKPTAIYSAQQIYWRSKNLLRGILSLYQQNSQDMQILEFRAVTGEVNQNLTVIF